MLSIYSEDKELIEAIRHYNRVFKVELIEEEMLKEAEKGAFHVLGLPSVDKKKLLEAIELSIKNLTPLKDPDIFLELAGFTKEEIEYYKRGDLLIR